MDRALHATHILYLNPQIGVYLDSQALGRTKDKLIADYLKRMKRIDHNRQVVIPLSNQVWFTENSLSEILKLRKI